MLDFSFQPARQGEPWIFAALVVLADLCRVESLPLFFASQAGYLVEELEEWPGQPEIRAGDVIVAIGEEHEAQKSIRESENDSNETKRHMLCVLAAEKSGLLMALVRVLIRKTMKIHQAMLRFG